MLSFETGIYFYKLKRVLCDIIIVRMMGGNIYEGKYFRQSC